MTKLARNVHATLIKSKDPILVNIDMPDFKILWPGQSDNKIWPEADISGILQTGERFIIEIDDTTDPSRSVIKYWPLLYAIQKGECKFPPICFIEISAPNDTLGNGYQILAKFVGERFKEMYSSHFRYGYIELVEGKKKSAEDLVPEILNILKGGNNGQRA